MGTLQGKKVSEKSDVSGSKDTKKTPEAVGHGSSPLWQKLAFGEGATTNNSSTGLPVGLQNALESLSGEDLSDIKVHKNSDKPSKMQALAYTQGINIYVSPGQEQHIPHEAWHTVQQKQGRVKLSIQMKSTLVNDDPALEKEADWMGEKAQSLTNTAGNQVMQESGY